MRILHTSDWHLGAATNRVSRLEDQQRFLDWLLELLQERQVDVLVVAGDVFDTMHPSNDALAAYYRFVARVGATGVRDVVIVGGNHDSPSQLDAPRSLLHAVDVRVVGGIPGAEERNARMVVPLRERGSDTVAAACLAVPYVHEYRLGIRTTDLDRSATREAFREAFADLYRGLAEHAEASFPGVPLIATGHLTLGTGASREDYPQEIHQVGTIEGLPTDLLDRRVRYTALGHIHRCYPVGDTTAWYCGTPIPYSLTEARTPRNVLLVEIEGEAAPRVERIEVPLLRDLVEVTGSADEVVDAIRDLTWTTELPPLVHARVRAAVVDPGLGPRLHEALAEHDEARRPVLVDLKQQTSEMDGLPATAPPPLRELTPGAVFELLCEARRYSEDDRQPLVTKFDALASADAETFQAMLEDVDLPPADGGDAG